MLLKAEFEADMSFLEPAIAAMICAGQGKTLGYLKYHNIMIVLC
jgi:hypothetical protein